MFAYVLALIWRSMRVVEIVLSLMIAMISTSTMGRNRITAKWLGGWPYNQSERADSDSFEEGWSRTMLILRRRGRLTFFQETLPEFMKTNIKSSSVP